MMNQFPLPHMWSIIFSLMSEASPKGPHIQLEHFMAWVFYCSHEPEQLTERMSVGFYAITQENRDQKNSTRIPCDVLVRPCNKKTLINSSLSHSFLMFTHCLTLTCFLFFLSESARLLPTMKRTWQKYCEAHIACNWSLSLCLSLSLPLFLYLNTYLSVGVTLFNFDSWLSSADEWLVEDFTIPFSNSHIYLAFSI